ncbi:MAG: hypothetical protein ACRD68_04795, partial [Pyrinomonadaceae bacterium]
MFKSNPRPRIWRHTLAVWLLVVSLLTTPALSFAAPAAETKRSPAAPTLSDAERQTMARVRVETIREVTAALSAEEMQGRGTGQPGGERAARYVADRFAKLGLKPLGDRNSFFQQIKFREFQVTPDSFFKADDEPLVMREDFYA